jgi:hypothetical protein
MRHLSFLLLLIGLPVWAATVWKWRDADGVTHYSDQPVPGAVQINADPTNTYTSSPVTNTASAAQSSSSSAVAVTQYSVIEITSPASEATIAGTGGTVQVAGRLEPALASNHRLMLYLDGQPVPNYPPQALSYSLTDVARGEHNVMLAVVSSNGTQVASSAPVTFYVQQPSVLRKK